MAKEFINHDRMVWSYFPARDKIPKDVCII
jgi:hypothetical protein